MIRIGVVSDTHGQWQQIATAFKSCGKIDLICHAGDLYEDGIALGKHLAIDTKVVSGNCDPGRWEQELLFELGEKLIFLTHGHLYGVKNDYQRLVYKAQELQAQIVICGHTHMPVQFQVEDTLFLNPGSPTSPRNYSPGNYGIIEIDHGTVSAKIHQLF